jgi:hypothetical protein
MTTEATNAEILAAPSLLEGLAWTVDSSWRDPGGGKKKRWVSDTKGQRARYQIIQPLTRAPAKPKAKKPRVKTAAKSTGGAKGKAAKSPGMAGTSAPASAPPPAAGAKAQPQPQPKAPPPQPKQQTPAASPPKSQMQAIAAQAEKHLSDPAHPMNAKRAQLGDATFAGNTIKTVRSTKDSPLSSQEHAAMAGSHFHVAKILKLNGNAPLAASHEAAAQHHVAAAKAKAGGATPPPVAQTPAKPVAPPTPQQAPPQPKPQVTAQPAPQSQSPPPDPVVQSRQPVEIGEVYRPAKNVAVAYDGDAKSAVRSVFGSGVKPETLAAMVNAVDGAKVKVRREYDDDDNEVAVVSMDADGVTATRSFHRNAAGELVCHNDYFEIDKTKAAGQSGIDIFLNQVRALKAMGVDRIETQAAGEKGAKHNGYYTWARFGYDGTIARESFSKLSPELQQQMGKSRSVQDLFKLEGGKEAWKEHGSDIDDAEFDLSDGSRSMKVLQEYLAERSARGGK